MKSRRSFLQKSVAALGAFSIAPAVAKAMANDVSDALLELNELSPLEAASDEELWLASRKHTRSLQLFKS